MTVVKASLIIADSEKDTDLYYATGFLAPDPFMFIEIDGRKFLIMNDLELNRAKVESRADEVLSSFEIISQLRERGVANPTLVDIADKFFRDRKIKNLTVPASFPIEYTDPLRSKGYTLTFQKEPFFKERLVKTKEEVQRIKRSLEAAEHALEKAIQVISSSEIREDSLYYEGKPLTSEKIKEIMNLSLMHEDCMAQRTIVSCGIDSFDPHHEGKGPLLPHQPIVIDIFPRSNKTRYFADLSRTIVRGHASEKLQKMYQAVLEGQKIACGIIKDGVDGRNVHQAILNYFNSVGFESGMIQGRFQGFIHGTGHGLGLDLHELPRINKDSHFLNEGQAVTVEPGLYYLDTGGVRLEDIVVVTKTGVRNLTRFPKVLEC